MQSVWCFMDTYIRCISSLWLLSKHLWYSISRSHNHAEIRMNWKWFESPSMYTKSFQLLWIQIIGTFYTTMLHFHILQSVIHSDKKISESDIAMQKSKWKFVSLTFLLAFVAPCCDCLPDLPADHVIIATCF